MVLNAAMGWCRGPRDAAREMDGAREPPTQRIQHSKRRVELRGVAVGDGNEGPHALQGLWLNVCCALFDSKYSCPCLLVP